MHKFVFIKKKHYIQLYMNLYYKPYMHKFVFIKKNMIFNYQSKMQIIKNVIYSGMFLFQKNFGKKK